MSLQSLQTLCWIPALDWPPVSLMAWMEATMLLSILLARANLGLEGPPGVLDLAVDRNECLSKLRLKLDSLLFAEDMEDKADDDSG